MKTFNFRTSQSVLDLLIMVSYYLQNMNTKKECDLCILQYY
jgi:hypothetical protein